MPGTHQEYILLYRKLAEDKLLLGNGHGRLKQRDFEYIAEKIEERCRVRLSISTLKRIWKDDGMQDPHPATLDALVSILDFSDWQSFRKEHAASVIAPAQPIPPSPKRLNVRVPLLITSAVVLLVVVFFALEGFRKSGSHGVVVSGDVPFSADKTVTSGVPNTVMFRYDLSKVKADSFFIQQSWNPRDKQVVDPDNQYFSTIYYTPGFHWARLIANDSMIRFASVHVKTDGWMPIVQYNIRDGNPFYVDPKKIKRDGIIIDDAPLLKAVNVDLTKEFQTRFYNIRDFDGIDSDHFDIETRFRCELLPGQSTNTGNVPCPRMEIMLVTEGDIYYVALMSKGCVSNVYLKMGEVYKNGKEHDLSALGCDPYAWQTLRIIDSGKNVEIRVGDIPVHTMDYKKDFGKIKGIIYTFTGSGSVDYIRMADTQGKVVYADEFEN